MINSDYITVIIGIGASIGTDASLVPQLIKLIRDKKSEDISMGMLAMLFIGLILWIIYGVIKKDWVIIISNILSLIVNIAVSVLSLKYRSQKA